MKMIFGAWCLMVLCLAVASAEELSDNAYVPAKASENVDAVDAAREKDIAADEREEIKDEQEIEDEGDSWVDETHDTVEKTVSGFARWLDSFFGDGTRAEERDYTHGRIEAAIWWDEQEGFAYPVNFRANLSFPQFERRMNAFLGRTNENDQLSEAGGQFSELPPVFQALADEDDEWLAGLGYSPIKNRENRLDLDAGVNLTLSKFQPFAKVRYRGNLLLGDRNLIRFRQIGYWKDRDGFGTSTRLDLDRILSQDFLFRWANSGNYSERTQGVDWWSELDLFQHLGEERGIVYIAAVSGESEAPVALKDYGFGVSYRQRLFRKWLFGYLGGSVRWPKKVIEDERKSVFGVGFGFEMRFGQRPQDFEES